MINLAARDILHSWGKFVLTGAGLGLLIGVTLSMAGIYRGMVDDAKVLIDNAGSDLWVVQKDTLGPYAEPSSIPDDTYRTVAAMRDVAQASNVTYLTLQVRSGDKDIRALLVGITSEGPDSPGHPRNLVAGRPIARNHYEAVADLASGLKLGDEIEIRGDRHTVVGLTRRMVSSSGDPMIVIPLKDAQRAQFLKDDEAIRRQRLRNAYEASRRVDPIPGLADALSSSQARSTSVNAVLVRVRPGSDPDAVAADIRRWLQLQVYTRKQMEDILVGKLILTSARQIATFLVILSIVSAALVAFMIYTLTMGKLREIAVLKLIGTRNRTIAWMILQQSIGLGLIGFVTGRIVATFWAPYFPKYVLLLPVDSLRGFVVILVICAIASLVAIRAALRVDAADALGG